MLNIALFVCHIQQVFISLHTKLNIELYEKDFYHYLYGYFLDDFCR